MKHCVLLIISFFSLYGCSRGDKIDISTITIDREIEVKSVQSQTSDSIIIFNTNKIITTTGDSIYNITTKFEKRKRDSILAVNKYPNPFAPVMTHFSYSLNDHTDFIIIVYDNSGMEVKKLVDGKFSKGVYEVYFDIYSIFKPGTYYAAVYHQIENQYFKLIVK